MAILAIAVGALSSSAGAATYKACGKAPVKNTGHFTTKECAVSGEVATGGKFELLAPSGQPFTTKSREVRFGLGAEGGVQCMQSTGSGSVTSEANSTFALTGTQCTGGGKECHSAGQTAGVIRSEYIGTLLQVSPTEVEQIETATGPEELVAEIFCVGIPTIRVKGSAGGRVGILGAVPKKANTLRFNFGTVQEMSYEIEGGSSGPSVLQIFELSTKKFLGVYPS